MDKLISVEPTDKTAIAEAGIYGPALEEALTKQGATLGHFPQSFEFSSLGGWIAHRGSGQLSNRYGSANNWLISAELATSRGRFSTEAFPASAAGPQLVDLIPGSEGQFGIITRASFRVRPIPQRRLYWSYLFPNFESGVNAIRTAAQEDVETAMLRLSDPAETKFYRDFTAIGKKGKPVRESMEKFFLGRHGLLDTPSALVAAFEGDTDSVSATHRKFQAIAKRFGASSLGRERGESWYRNRFQGPYLRDPLLDHGVGVDTLETAVSWSRLAPLYTAIRKALEETIAANVPCVGARGIVMCHIGHSYSDGACLYFTYLFPRDLENEIPQWEKIKRSASEAIVANGGTISHHHGIGQDHLPWIRKEKGDLGIEVLRAIKRTLDPSGILNPGKLLPPDLP
jgi:alkyldihydroxyacetonephosphate synthase